MKTLNELRQQIDVIDKAILDLLEKRMEVTDQVGEYKNKNKISFTTKDREESLKDTLTSLTKHPVMKDDVGSFFQQIIDTSKKSMSLHTTVQTPFNRVAVIGLGLIGGSIAKTLKSTKPTIRLSTLKRNSEDTQLAIESNIIDIQYDNMSELLQHNELVILASPIDTIIPIAKLIFEASHQLSHKVIVIDTASVKSEITKIFGELTNEKVEFLPTHPMAGSEKIGFKGARVSLFIDRPWVITSHAKNKKESIEKIQSFVQTLGSKPIVVTSEEHDQNVAIVSHLIFLISAYLFAFPQERNRRSLNFAGNGFETTTRLASGNTVMHKQIVENNFENIQKTITEFIEFIKSQPITRENALEFFEKNKQARDEYIENK